MKISETTKERGVRGHEISISLERKRHTTSKAKQKGETNKSKKEETRERERERERVVESNQPICAAPLHSPSRAQERALLNNTLP
ncbi:Os12g0122400 [Oryza sativa Japonica Group]|jgi:hypothetical protein|uniref:Os12g0122400 protein n=2 Tax=Oryza sativa subsp. japonica TaxID=39947 RepID=B9GBL4_ORYSJ|nr:hypothetical protein OsJ_35050 [Oryza sativa Japonica Group]BAT15661.1 Os12g0122400 [Oryza sativa Japonica Group]